MLKRLKSWARAIKIDVVALYVSLKDDRTPLLAKIMAVGVVTYALSPIDLIPDFIPVLGFVDDLLIVPLGIAIAVRLIPLNLMSEFRSMAIEHERLPASRTGGFIVVFIWLTGLVFCCWWACSRYSA